MIQVFESIIYPLTKKSLPWEEGRRLLAGDTRSTREGEKYVWVCYTEQHFYWIVSQATNVKF